MASYLFVDCVFIFAMFAAAFVLQRQRHRPPLPPGPKRLPLIGNLLNRPTRYLHLAYTDMKSQFGDLMSLEVLGQPFIVVNSIKVANELFEKRSANYADRPGFRTAKDFQQLWWNFSLMPYSDEWRLLRKAFYQYFQAKRVADYRPAQLAATYTLLTQMLESPSNFFSHLRHYSGSTILRVTYGYRAQPTGDRHVATADNSVRGMAHILIPGTYIFDYFPILTERMPSWFPFGSIKREAMDNARYTIAARDEPFYEVLQSMDAGTAEPCFITTGIENSRYAENPAFDVTTVVKNAAGVAFIAGADTTVAVVLTVILALVHAPGLLVRAHAELDKVVGRDRLPNFDDYGRLKFIEAIMLEAMRWRPVAPLSIAHAAISDDIYDGYFIPAGSVVTGNVWAILHDATTYRDPSAFNPDRFMGSEPEPHPTSVFGFGRRICPGRYFASNSSFIAIASLLWAFNIAPEEDPNGNHILPDTMAYTEGIVAHPMPFKCKITPRFEAVKKIIGDNRDTRVYSSI